MCHTLDDYLRRRTNIAQWIPRRGLGPRDEHVTRLTELAKPLYGDDDNAARQAVEEYQQDVVRTFDAVLSNDRAPGSTP